MAEPDDASLNSVGIHCPMLGDITAPPEVLQWSGYEIWDGDGLCVNFGFTCRCGKYHEITVRDDQHG